MKHLFLICATLALAIVSCKKEGTINTSIDPIGKYIYRDDNDIHHVNSRCIKLRNGRDDAGHEIYAMHLIDTVEFVITDPDYFRLCSRCVSDNEYEHIKMISRRNQRSQRNKEADITRKWLYDHFIGANYDMGEYEDFVIDISIIEKRMKLYNAALAEGWHVGSTFDEFSELLGF